MLLTAMACGALLGIEREIRQQPAGVRTIMLITVGSAIFMLAGRIIAERMVWPESVTRIDPGRLASYVIAGIGFLGAGPILARGSYVHGLTTAASIWVAAGIGIVIGLEEYRLGWLITGLVMVVLFVLSPLSGWLGRLGPKALLVVRHQGSEVDRQRLLAHLGYYAISGVDERRAMRDDGLAVSECVLRFRSHPRTDKVLFDGIADIADCEVATVDHRAGGIAWLP